MTSILVHYSELALKGKNRPWFIHRLVRNLHAALAGLSVKEVRTPIGSIEIVLNHPETMEEVQDRLSRVFGIANYSAAIRVPLDFDGMADAIVAHPTTITGSIGVVFTKFNLDPFFEWIGTNVERVANLFVTKTVLQTRQRWRDVFVHGEYAALPAGDHAIAFTRTFEGRVVFCCVPRLPYRLTRGERPWPLGDVWNSQTVPVPAGRYRDAFTAHLIC